MSEVSKKLRFSCIWMIAIASTVCSASFAAENIINTNQTVANGGYYPVKFPGSQEADPIWSLTIIPVLNHRHIPESLTRPNIMWVWESKGGGCNQPARIKCATAVNPSEIQFHSRIFTGLIEPCEAIPGPPGLPGPPPKPWTIDARTHFYRVLPEEEIKCVGCPATFKAQYYDKVQNQQEEALSTWTCVPANGVTIDPADPSKTVAVTASLPGNYVVIGTSVASANLTDEARLTVVEVDKIIATKNGKQVANSDDNGNAGHPGYACVGEVTFDAYTDGTTLEQNFPEGQPTWKIKKLGPEGGAPIPAGSGPQITRNFTEPGKYWIQAKCCESEKKVFLFALKVDMDIWNGGSDLDNGQTVGSQGSQVPEGSEVSTGAYVLVNWDDDDADGTMNNDGTWSALPVPDLTASETSVANEDNLAKLKPTVEPLLDTGTIELEVSGSDAGRVKLWTQSTKGTQVTLTSNKKTWNLANSTEKADFQTFMNDGYWIEGTDVGTAERGVTFTVRYKDSGGTEICKDDNKATVVMINLANAVARDNMIDLWGIGQNSRGHSALVWRYAGTCTKADLTNDLNFILIEMGGPTDTRNLTTITQQAGYPAYGCFRNPSMTYVQRLRIIRAARALADRAPINYTPWNAALPDTWNGDLDTITGLRCDGLVEVCYEINGVEAWGMERDPDSHTVHYPINNQSDNWSYSPTWGTWSAGANGLPDNLEEHNDFDGVGWADTFMPATQCGNVAPVEADTQLEEQNLCQPIGSTGGN